VTGRRDEFLSDEDLDLANLTVEERWRWYTAWLRWAQATNDQDWHLYSHGVFTVDPLWKGPPPPRDRFT
jgi:hypothetical protein